MYRSQDQRDRLSREQLDKKREEHEDRYRSVQEYEDAQYDLQSTTAMRRSMKTLPPVLVAAVRQDQARKLDRQRQKSSRNLTIASSLFQ